MRARFLNSGHPRPRGKRLFGQSNTFYIEINQKKWQWCSERFLQKFICELDFQIFEFFSQILSLKLEFEWRPYLFGPLWDRIRRQKWQGSTERVFGGLTIRHCFDNAWSESSGDKKESASIGALSMSSGVSLRARIKVIWEIKSKKDWTDKQTNNRQ